MATREAKVVAIKRLAALKLPVANVRRIKRESVADARELAA
jgi:hypothetical protein